MPNFINELAKHNAKHGITATFSELKKTARRMDRIYADSEAARKAVDPLAYILDFWDSVGEEATDNVMTERAERAARNAAAAARRLRVAA